MTDSQFDPNQYISKVKGQDYLEVKWRIAWLRHDHPDAILDTELISHENGRAVMRARVMVPAGGSATGWGSETAQNFENYIEKAETKAIGRALTALGYGTPAVDADEAVAPSRAQASPPRSGQPEGATSPQRNRIQRLAKDLKLDPAQFDALVRSHTGVDFQQINKRQASGIIDMLESRVAPRAS